MSGPPTLPEIIVWMMACLTGLHCSGGPPGSGGPPAARVIYANRLDSLDSILTRTGVSMEDQAIRIDANNAMTVRLVEIRPEAAQNVTLVFRGHLRSDGLKGRAYFEIRCSGPGTAEHSAKGLKQAVSGTTDWTTQATPLDLAPSETCVTTTLSVVVEGTGIVRVRNIAVGQVSH